MSRVARPKKPKAGEQYIDLYGGKASGKLIGSLKKGPLEFQIISPGLDIQGRNRLTWTQFCYEGVPVWETKLSSTLKAAIERFDGKWAESFGEKYEYAKKVIEAEVKSRKISFKDGIAGEAPAPSIQYDELERINYTA